MPKKQVKWMIPLILAMIGFGIDFILFYNKISHTESACPLGGNCDLVNNSVFSEIFGIPVSLFGMGSFALFFVVSWLAWHKKIEEIFALKVIAVVSGLGLLGAAYFVYIMLFVLEAICTWCLFSHTVLLIIFLWSLTHYGDSKNGGKKK